MLTVSLQDAPAPSAHVMFCILPAFFFFMSSLQLRPQPRKQSVSPSWNLVPVLEALPPASLPVKNILENQFQEPVSQSVGWPVGRWCRTSRGTVSIRSKQKNPPGLLFCADGFPAGWTERLFPTDLGAEEKTETTRRDLMMRC